MPKYRQQREFQIGEYWLAKRAGSPAWHRFWFDTTTRQTRRASLGTTDFDEAKEILTDWFVGNRQLKNVQASEILLAEVLQRYWEEHGKNLASSDSIQKASAYWLDFFCRPKRC